MRDVTGGRRNGVSWSCAGVVMRDLSMGWEYTASLNSWMVLHPYESLFCVDLGPSNTIIGRWYALWM